MINSQSTRTLRLPHGDGTAQPPRRLPLYSEGVILIPAVFNRIVQMQKSTLGNKYLKTVSVLRLSTLFTERKNQIKTEVSKYKVGK